jgi:hypothetical protein
MSDAAPWKIGGKTDTLVPGAPGTYTLTFEDHKDGEAKVLKVEITLGVGTICGQVFTDEGDGVSTFTLTFAGSRL